MGRQEVTLLPFTVSGRRVRNEERKDMVQRRVLVEVPDNEDGDNGAVATVVEPIALSGDVSNGGEATIQLDAPYRVSVTVTGSCEILFHRWQSDSVDAKAAAAKGSKAKKTDDVESYVWRNDANQICLPGEYLRGSLIDPRNGAAKYRQDPRSPRKSALDLYRASIISLTPLAPITKADGSIATEWDSLDRRRVTVQRQGVTRERPCFATGWSATVLFMCQSPNYIPPTALHQALNDAGRLVGVGDFRPSFGRFTVTNFELLNDDAVV
jgi:hypothetical protein